MRLTLLIALLIFSFIDLYILSVYTAFSSGIVQKCPKDCPSSCSCDGNNCSGTAASCGGTVYCDCTDTNCHNSAQCPSGGGGGGSGGPPGPVE